MCVIRPELLGALACLNFSVTPLYADLFDDYVNSVSRSPFVVFLARESEWGVGKPGHAYIGVGVELDNGQLVYERLLGYYPIDESTWGQVKATFSSVSGELKSKIEDISWSVEYRVDLDDSKHSAAISVADHWMASDPKYNLFSQDGKNCNAFVQEVARSIGLKLPYDDPGSTWPIDYINSLKSANE